MSLEHRHPAISIPVVMVPSYMYVRYVAGAMGAAWAGGRRAPVARVSLKFI